MLNVDTIKNGLVIDHICAGYGPKIFRWLGLEKANFTAALVMNVNSKTMGKKDIIKVDNIINIDFSVLGFIDPNITVNVIKDEKTVKKIKMSLPSTVENVIKCKNPRLAKWIISQYRWTRWRIRSIFALFITKIWYAR